MLLSNAARLVQGGEELGARLAQARVRPEQGGRRDIREYFATANLQEVLRRSLSEILQQNHRLSPPSLLNALGRELVRASGAVDLAELSPPSEVVPSPKASTEAKQLREDLAELQRLHRDLLAQKQTDDARHQDELRGLEAEAQARAAEFASGRASLDAIEVYAAELLKRLERVTPLLRKQEQQLQLERRLREQERPEASVEEGEPPEHRDAGYTAALQAQLDEASESLRASQAENLASAREIEALRSRQHESVASQQAAAEAAAKENDALSLEVERLRAAEAEAKQANALLQQELETLREQASAPDVPAEAATVDRLAVLEAENARLRAAGSGAPAAAEPAPRDQAISVDFTETGSLGLKLIWEQSSRRVTVKGLNEGTQAEGKEQLRRRLAQGLLLQSVGGENVVGKSYQETIAIIKASSRPLTITFDPLPPSPSREDERDDSQSIPPSAERLALAEAAKDAEETVARQRLEIDSLKARLVAAQQAETVTQPQPEDPAVSTSREGERDVPGEEEEERLSMAEAAVMAEAVLGFQLQKENERLRSELSQLNETAQAQRLAALAQLDELRAQQAADAAAAEQSADELRTLKDYQLKEFAEREEEREATAAKLATVDNWRKMATKLEAENARLREAHGETVKTTPTPEPEPEPEPEAESEPEDEPEPEPEEELAYTPSQSGTVRCQFAGKKKWHKLYLEVDKEGALTFRGNKAAKDGSRKLLREGSALACSVGELKNQRKGHSHAFRLDLAEKDSEGDSKHVVSTESAEEKAHWMEVLGAYSKLTQVAAATSVRSSLSLQQDDEDADEGPSEQPAQHPDVLSPGLSEAKAVAGAKGTKQQEAAAAAKARRQAKKAAKAKRQDESEAKTKTKATEPEPEPESEPDTQVCPLSCPSCARNDSFTVLLWCTSPYHWGQAVGAAPLAGSARARRASGGCGRRDGASTGRGRGDDPAAVRYGQGRAGSIRRFVCAGGSEYEA